MKLRTFYLRNKLWYNDWRAGSLIGKQYKEVEFIAEHSFGEGLPLHEKAVHELLSYAPSHTLFYASYNSMNLTDYPVMNKLALIANHDQIAVGPSKILGQEGEVFVQKTSRSTGTPFAMPQVMLKRKRRIAEIKYYGKQLGYNSHEKLIHLCTWNKW